MSKKKINKRIDDLFEDIKGQRRPVKSTTPDQPKPSAPRVENRLPAAAAAHVQKRRSQDAAVLALPLNLGGDEWADLEIIGDEDIWDEDAELLAQQVADQLSLALDNARLFQETERRARELELINRIVTMLSDYTQVEEAVTQIGHHMAQFFDFLYVGFVLLDSDEKNFTVISRTEDQKINPSGGKLSSDFPLLQQIKQGKQEFLSIDLVKTPVKHPVIASVTRALKTSRLILWPVWSQNKLIALSSIHLDAKRENLTTREKALLRTIYSQISNVLETARLFRMMRESEARFRDVALASADWVWEIDATGDFTYCSDRVRDVLGYEPEEIIGKRPADFMLPDDIPVVQQAMEQFVRSRTPITSLESRHITKDGKIVILQSDAVPVVDARGQLIGYRGVYRNITERKNAENLQKAIYQIAEASLQADTLQELLHKIHDTIRSVLPAKNFFVALYDTENDLLEFPYFVDQFDQEPPQAAPLGAGLTSKVIQRGEPLFIHADDFSKMEAEGVDVQGPHSIDWLGVPLRTKQAIIGVMAIQTYDPQERITDQHAETFNLLATQVASALERYLSSQALARSEAELRTLFASMEDVILVVGKDTTYLRIAPTNPSGLYRAPDELIGKRMVDIFDNELGQYFQETVTKALQGDESVKIEYPLDIRGETVWFDATISKLTDDEVFWVARDITERKQAEEKLRRRNEYLAAASEVGRLITSTLDLNTLFRRAVNLVAERFGYDHVAIFTLDEGGLNAVLREATGEVGQAMKESGHQLAVGSQSLVGQVTEKGEPIIINDTQASDFHRFNPLLPETRAEAGIPLKIGRRIIGLLDLQSKQVNAFHEEDIAVLQIVADQIAIAIDNARSYELAQQAVREMREADRMKSQFLANMSHELRTPLNSIIGFSRVILKGIDGPLTELQQQDLTSIYNSGQHLLGLINDILDLSRIEAGKMELSFDEVDAKALIESVLSTARGLVKDKPVELVQKVPEDLPTIRADQMRIRQVLLNLVSNAAKFTEEGSITVEAHVQTNEKGLSELYIGVTDTGPGISKEDQAKLFQPFSQVDASLTRKVGGSGLGLSISRRLVHMHGGEIDLHSEIGKGSTFFFTVPLFHQPEKPVQINSADNETAQGLILSIDDDPQVIGLYERYLSHQGWQVIPLTDPSKALEKARELQPTAITLDIMMPEINGWEILQALKADPQTQKIPIIVCSILEESEKGISLGAADYLTKPILQEDLLDALERLSGETAIQEVLIIDDNPDDRRLIDKIISGSQQYKTRLAPDGNTGLKIIQETPPQVIILDLFMPEMDGFTVLERLRADENLRHIPVILVTGADLTPEQKDWLEKLGHRLLQKAALNQEELLTSLNEALQRLSK